MEEPIITDEFRKRFEEWRQKTYELFLKWQREEGLTIDQCLKRFWGDELIEKWKKL